MRVAFVPVWHNNPYHTELKKTLRSLGIEVLCPPSLKAFCRTSLAGAAKLDVMHLHSLPLFDWTLPSVRRYAMFSLRLRQLQKRGVRLVWTIHDLQNHESEHRWVEG